MDKLVFFGSKSAMFLTPLTSHVNEKTGRRYQPCVMLEFMGGRDNNSQQFDQRTKELFSMPIRQFSKMCTVLRMNKTFTEVHVNKQTGATKILALSPLNIDIRDQREQQNLGVSQLPGYYATITVQMNGQTTNKHTVLLSYWDTQMIVSLQSMIISTALGWVESTPNTYQQSQPQQPPPQNYR